MAPPMVAATDAEAEETWARVKGFIKTPRRCRLMQMSLASGDAITLADSVNVGAGDGCEGASA